MTELLKGERVSIRPVESEEDAKYLFQTFNDPQSVGKFVAFEARSWENFQNFIRESSKPPTQFTAFLIERNEDKKMIGSAVHFVPHPLSKMCVEIGYGIDYPDLRGKGYASEAARLLVDYLFLTRPLERVQATINVDNLGSQAVVEKLGFMKEGTLRKNDYMQGRFCDTAIYSLLRGEWEKRR